MKSKTTLIALIAVMTSTLGAIANEQKMKASPLHILQGSVLAINDDPGGHNGQAGIVYASNSALTDSSISAELSGFSTGWEDQTGLAELLEFLAPVVAAPKGLFEYRQGLIDEQNVGLEKAPVRGRNVGFKQVDTGKGLVSGKTQNKGLKICIDRDVEDYPGIEEDKIAFLKGILIRAEIIEAFAALDGAAGALAAEPDWSAAAAEPDSDVEEMLDFGEDNGGLRATRVIYSSKAFSARRRALRNNDYSYDEAKLTVAQLADVYGLPAGGVMKSEHVYSTRKDGNQKIIDPLTIYTFNARSGLTKDDPSNIKRFKYNPSAGLERVFRWDSDGGKLSWIAVELYSSVVVTAPLGITKATITPPAAQLAQA